MKGKRTREVIVKGRGKYKEMRGSKRARDGIAMKSTLKERGRYKEMGGSKRTRGGMAMEGEAIRSDRYEEEGRAGGAGGKKGRYEAGGGHP